MTLQIKLSVFLLSISPFFYSQEYPNLLSSTKITTIGYWNLGQKARYKVKHNTSNFKGDSKKPSSENVCEYQFTIEVVDSTETSYQFELKYDKFSINGEQPDFLKEIIQMQNSMVIRYQTNELGQFDTILNLVELRQTFSDQLDLIRDKFSSLVTEKEEKEIFIQTFDNFTQRFKELDDVEDMFIEDILYLHGFYGIEMTLSKPLDIELLYSTIGDNVLTGMAKITLNSINKKSDECSFAINGKPNKEELKEYITSIALLFMLENKKKIDFETVSISQNTKTKMVMELSSGWMNNVIEKQTVTIKDKKRDYKKVIAISYDRL
jgi:coenzyme F420-reducing hydrogenase delta subunit